MANHDGVSLKSSLRHSSIVLTLAMAMVGYGRMMWWVLSTRPPAPDAATDNAAARDVCWDMTIIPLHERRANDDDALPLMLLSFNFNNDAIVTLLSLSLLLYPPSIASVAPGMMQFLSHVPLNNIHCLGMRHDG
jgi:hypothetical protein